MRKEEILLRSCGSYGGQRKMETITMLYFSGCVLFERAKEFDDSTKKSFAELDIELKELPDDWICCGAYVSLIDENSSWLVSPVTNLIIVAQSKYSNELTTGCSCCYNVLKRANNAMKDNIEKQKTINAYFETNTENYYSGQVKVLHLLEILRDKIGFDNLAKKVKKDLSNLKIAAYYGCNLVRPYDEIRLDKPEQPKILDDFIKAVGAQAIDYPYKTMCCSKDLSMKKQFSEIAKLSSQKIVSSAKQAGAEIIITSCPLCFYNLEQCQKDWLEKERIPVVYFTEILAKALGV
jgi:heterodisulfide reductase subunit B